jgi:hypothetical protein
VTIKLVFSGMSSHRVPENRYQSTKQGEWKIRLNCMAFIRELPGSNPIRDTYYSEWDISWLSSVPLGISHVNTLSQAITASFEILNSSWFIDIQSLHKVLKQATSKYVTSNHLTTSEISNTISSSLLRYVGCATFVVDYTASHPRGQ